MTPLPWLGIAGPTASGKSALAMALAAHASARGQAVEIISVDSALVYRGMDIGTAKPSAAELAQVPHHLIDIRDPLHAYSAADFARDATRLVADIHARGAVPLLVGGTMLYFKALIDGIDDLPQADPTVRTMLAERAEALGWPALHAELAQIDPPTAARLSPNDSQRIQRALEVYQLTGQPISALFSARNSPESIANNQYHTSRECLISLEPRDRSWLHRRIAQRFDAMLDAGFLDEVKTLRARGDKQGDKQGDALGSLHPDLPSMRCVGYRQAWEYLDRVEAMGNVAPGATGANPAQAQTQAFATMRELGIIATRQLAKRQLTWLRSLPQRHVIACDADPAQVFESALQHSAAFLKP
jgi:tRNA dimethylallyltransferase